MKHEDKKYKVKLLDFIMPNIIDNVILFEVNKNGDLIFKRYEAALHGYEIINCASYASGQWFSVEEIKS